MTSDAAIGVMIGSFVGTLLAKLIPDWWRNRKLRNTKIGYTACWKPTSRGNCRMPKDHSGDCI
jgi:hypothetical protein